ncbi:hypothetical protein SAMN05421538_11219 [Paracoccus isoporae]|uniref:Uncharacterized protein n=2 Tax=Paracoccus isoporae TaxID=591205 RepID=A0A1G7G1Q6_9RHOB|nr:hypothetical protein SAMN05421538_11219 [Paracoccus isoporae]
MIRNTKVVGVAEFTRDMAQTLTDYFDTYAVEGIVSIELGDDGTLWLPNRRLGGRQFLGMAKLPAEAKIF